MKTTCKSLLVSAAVVFGFGWLSTNVRGAAEFIPGDLRFWDNSANWTTDYGPAYRDTVLKLENMLPCDGPYALCFTSGPQPLPCKPSKDGRTAECTCTAQNGRNYVLLSAILNYRVYLDTVAVCGPEGRDCVLHPNKAPVCAAIASGKLTMGADLISTFDPGSKAAIGAVLAAQPPLKCPKAPYAACMTAPCKQKAGENPVCSCPVFNGVFQLPTSGATCNPGDGLIPSASFTPGALNQ